MKDASQSLAIDRHAIVLDGLEGLRWLFWMNGFFQVRPVGESPDHSCLPRPPGRRLTTLLQCSMYRCNIGVFSE